MHNFAKTDRFQYLEQEYMPDYVYWRIIFEEWSTDKSAWSTDESA